MTTNGSSPGKGLTVARIDEAARVCLGGLRNVLEHVCRTLVGRESGHVFKGLFDLGHSLEELVDHVGVHESRVKEEREEVRLLVGDAEPHDVDAGLTDAVAQVAQRALGNVVERTSNAGHNGKLGRLLTARLLRSLLKQCPRGLVEVEGCNDIDVD